MRSALMLAATICLWGANSASAQGPSFRPGPGGGGFGQGIGGAPGMNPTVSPYMNLYRRGTSIAVNYYGLVRPAIDLRGAINNLQQDVNEMPAPGTGSAGFDNLSPLLTGSRSRFMNTGNYFLSGVPLGNRMGGMGGGMGSGGGSIMIVGGQQGAPAANQGARMGGSVPATTSPRR